MILKSFLIERNIQLLEKYNIALIYGENEGIKASLKKNIKNSSKGVETITIFQDEIIKNNEILIKELSNPSLFSSKKIIFLHEITDKIYKQIIDCLDLTNEDLKIFIFSPILDKKSKIRNFFEKSKKLAIIPCYQDTERNLIIYLNTELRDFKGASHEIINLIISNSNSDRRIIDNELIKIKSFFTNKIIETSQLLELLNIKLSRDFDEIRDASLLGYKKKVNLLLGQVQFQTEDYIFYLNNLSRRVAKLHEIKRINEDTNDIELALDMLKSKVFWKDKPVYIEQLKKWSLIELSKTLTEIGKVELMMKKNSMIRSDVLIKDLLINVCNRAANAA